jgi:hypothetical protein
VGLAASLGVGHEHDSNMPGLYTFTRTRGMWIPEGEDTFASTSGWGDSTLLPWAHSLNQSINQSINGE